MSDTITLTIRQFGEEQVEVDRAEYEAAKAAGTVDHYLDHDLSDLDTTSTVIEPDGRSYDPSMQPYGPVTFEVTSEHLTLLRAMHWRWDDCEFGAPAVDSKRPFGSSSGIVGDIADALGRDDYDPDNEDQDDELRGIYAETMTVLMIGLSCGSFEPGMYEQVGTSWKRVAE